MSLLSKKSLARKLLKAKKFRDSFVSARITQTVALQIRVLRQQRVMSQAELAEALGTSQNAIYRLENPSYGKNSISTLKKVASFFDVGLVVRFEKYSDILDWVSRLDSESILVPSADNDARLRQAASGLISDANPTRSTSSAGGVYRHLRFVPGGQSGKISPTQNVIPIDTSSEFQGQTGSSPLTRPHPKGSYLDLETIQHA